MVFSLLHNLRLEGVDRDGVGVSGWGDPTLPLSKLCTRWNPSANWREGKVQYFTRISNVFTYLVGVKRVEIHSSNLTLIVLLGTSRKLETVGVGNVSPTL